jgi:hypothetical protein
MSEPVKAPPGHIIDDQGNVRKLNGELPLLADGSVAAYGEYYKYWDFNVGTDNKIRWGWTDRVLESCQPSESYECSYTTDPSRCWPSIEAAEAARAKRENKQ